MDVKNIDVSYIYLEWVDDRRGCLDQIFELLHSLSHVGQYYSISLH